MNAWMMLWTAVLLVALTFFTALSVTVTIGGFLDIRKMLRQLRHKQAGRRTDGDV